MSRRRRPRTTAATVPIPNKTLDEIARERWAKLQETPPVAK